MNKINKMYITRADNILIFGTCLSFIAYHFMLLLWKWIRPDDTWSSDSVTWTVVIPLVVSIVFPGCRCLFNYIRKKWKTDNSQYIDETPNYIEFLLPTADDFSRMDKDYFVKESKKNPKDRFSFINRGQHVSQIMKIIDEEFGMQGAQNSTNLYRCLFITGQSGAGKSFLLNTFLKYKLEEKGYQVHDIINTYD